jgi:hypothetical protein
VNTPTPEEGRVSDPLDTPIPKGLLEASSLAAPASLAAPSREALEAAMQAPAAGAVTDDPDISIDQPRFLTRADLGEPEIAATIAPPADLPFADGIGDETPFFGISDSGPGWTGDDTDGIPTGLPDLLAALGLTGQATASEEAPPEPTAPVDPLPHVAVADEERSDVFALPDDLSEEVGGDDWIEDAPSADVPAPVDKTADLHAQLDRARSAKWMFLVVGMVAGAALSAAWFSVA